MTTKKLLGGAALLAALAGGGVAGALLGAPITSSAQEDPTTTTVEEGTTDGGAGITEDGASADVEDACVGRPGFRHVGGRIAVDAAAEALGLSEADLREARRDGSTIAEVAEAEGVDLQTVIDAMVAAAGERIDQALENGRISAERAEELKAELPDRMAELVQSELPPPGRGHHRPGGPGPDDEAEPTGDTSEDTTDTTDGGS